MTWSEFSAKHNFQDTLSDLTFSYVRNFLKENSSMDIVGFGADCNAAYGNIFLSILSKEASDEIPLWQSKWEWIGEWDHWDLNQGFENDEIFVKIITELKSILFDNSLSDEQLILQENEFVDGLMSTLVNELTSLKNNMKSLSNAKLIIRDHGDLQEESESRINNII